jgi:hypothetical protein
MAVCDRSEILYPRQRNPGDRIWMKPALGKEQVGAPTVQVWTVEERFGIGSEFRQTCCAANNFRDHDLDLVKAILVHCAHRLLSESTLILRTLRNGPVESKRPATSPDCEVFQSLTHFLRSFSTV